MTYKSWVPKLLWKLYHTLNWLRRVVQKVSFDSNRIIEWMEVRGLCCERHAILKEEQSPEDNR